MGGGWGVVAADDANGPIYLLSVTPAALKGLNQYQKELAVRGIPPEIVKTRVTFDTDASFPKLKFVFGGFLDADTQAVVDGLFGTEQVKEITGEAPRALVDVAPVTKAPVRAAVAAKPAVKAAPAPEVAPEPAPAAAPKRGFGAAKAAAAPVAVTKPAKPAPAADAASTLADEIAALVGEMDADDA
jgi:hypothetical protein